MLITFRMFQVDLETARLELDLTTARAMQSEQHATRLDAALQAANQSVSAQQQALRESHERCGAILTTTIAVCALCTLCEAYSPASPAAVAPA